ncbi:MAG: IclR family transcriptional regulator [Planctomycetota bacterium]|nr:IclR family transcriptional regulator [Planctomycetota bacterium]
MSTENQQKSSYDAPALRKGIRLLELICESSKPLSVAEISRRLDLNKHMVLRLLGTLCDEGWVVVEEGPAYRASLVPLSHFSKPVARMDVSMAAEGPLDELWDITGETTYMSVCDLDHRDLGRSVGIVVRHGRRDVQVTGRAGSRLFMHSCAPGKVLLAHAEPELFERLAAEGFPRQTENTLCDPVELREELDQIVRQGYGVDNEEYLRGMLCLAAPIHDYTGKVIASIGITTLTLFHTLETMLDEYVEPVTEAGRRVSVAMGYLGANGTSGASSLSDDTAGEEMLSE